MNKKVKAVVIGGGVVGVSTLYHLAKKGWTDSILIERKELTSGSTWHAAGLLPLFNMSYSVGKLHQYSVNFYHELEKETGQNVGFKVVSNIRLACTQDRMDEYLYYSSVAQTVGVEVKFLTPEQVKEAWPMCNTSGLIGAIQHPDDGYIQPADLTQALAKGARARGAQIQSCRWTEEYECRARVPSRNANTSVHGLYRFRHSRSRRHSPTMRRRFLTYSSTFHAGYEDPGENLSEPD